MHPSIVFNLKLKEEGPLRKKNKHLLIKKIRLRFWEGIQAS